MTHLGKPHSLQMQSGASLFKPVFDGRRKNFVEFARLKCVGAVYTKRVVCGFRSKKENAMMLCKCRAGLVLLAVLGVGVWGAEPTRQSQAKRVIILVIDGPRWTETWGEPNRANIPHEAKELAPQGVMFTNFQNDGPTYTNAGHTALVTGNYVKKINNSGKELPPRPDALTEALHCVRQTGLGRVGHHIKRQTRNPDRQ